MDSYKDFVEECGYGDVQGIGGANCRCTAQLPPIYRWRDGADILRKRLGRPERRKPQI